MGFVMVPVPEEHYFDVMQHVVRLLARAAEKPWDKEAVDEFFRDSDEAIRSVVSHIARATVAKRPVSDLDVARALEIQLGDLSPIIMRINLQSKGFGRQMMFEANSVPELLPNGRVLNKRLLVMTEDVARMVRTAEQAARELEPHPLEDQAG